MRTLHWFRVDLRVHDNTGLHAAAVAARGAGGKGVVGLYLITPTDWARHDESPSKIDLMLRTVAALSADLAELNIPLLVRFAGHHREVPSIVAQVAKEIGAAEVHANRQYELHEFSRDEATGDALKAQGTKFILHHDQCAMPPGDVRTKDMGPSGGKPYTVYTPFKKRWIALCMEQGGIGSPSSGAGITIWPAPAKQEATGIKADAVPTFGDVPALAAYAQTLGHGPVDASIWPAGEAHARQHLEQFIARSGPKYKDLRDTPSLDATSRLSPYLAIGAISPRVCISLAQQANHGLLDAGNAGLAHWISEVLWREFYKHLFVAFPRLCKSRAFKPETERIIWNNDPKLLAAWQEGRTGVPIVDAGMRQLRAMGWMHNRLRMITAMYLTKDIFHDWRAGERHFMRHLVDGDLSQNNGGWQWSASTGTDAAPYFRIMNPLLQSPRCDPEGKYIKKYVPELRDVPAEFIHDPHGDDVPMTIRLKLDYPQPIVDRTKVKDRVMKAFQGVGAAAEAREV